MENEVTGRAKVENEVTVTVIDAIIGVIDRTVSVR